MIEVWKWPWPFRLRGLLTGKGNGANSPECVAMSIGSSTELVPSSPEHLLEEELYWMLTVPCYRDNLSSSQDMVKLRWTIDC